MVTYFDSRGKKVADCAMFLNAVVQIRVQCEEFKVSVMGARGITCAGYCDHNDSEITACLLT
jgi:hypothetical protein